VLVTRFILPAVPPTPNTNPRRRHDGRRAENDGEQGNPTGLAKVGPPLGQALEE